MELSVGGGKQRITRPSLAALYASDEIGELTHPRHRAESGAGKDGASPNPATASDSAEPPARGQMAHPPADTSRMQRFTDPQMSGLAFGSCLSG